jgi:glyoxylase-like metal-dependent hydrolase (beta-lactamase superfamily II)
MNSRRFRNACRVVVSLPAALLAVVLTGLLAGNPATAQQGPAQPAQDAIQVLRAGGNVYMLTGPDGNSAVQVEPPSRRPRIPGFYQGSYGVIVVDTMSAASAEALRAAVRRLSAGPMRFIINTHIHPVGGNAVLAKPAGGRTGRAGVETLIVSHESVLGKLADEGRNLEDGLPTDAFLDTREIWLNDEAIQLLHQPNAHTDGDTIVFFRKSDVIAAGDIFSTTSYPMFDVAQGGSIKGIIDGLNRILDIAIAESNQENGTMIIPGSGRLSDEADVVEYRNMVVMIRDRIQDMVKKGMTLQQVKAARPTLDYDFRYGANKAWTTDMFVEAVYKELSAAQPAARPATRR